MTENADALRSVLETPRFKSALADSLKVGSNRQIVLLSVPVKNSLEHCQALLVRDMFDYPECYWFDVNVKNIVPSVMEMLMDSTDVREDELSKYKNMRKIVACAVGVAACFQTKNLPGVNLREAIFAPVGDTITRFMNEASIDDFEVSYLRRSQNIAHRYRRALNAERKRDEEALRVETARAEGVSEDDELLFDAE